MILHSTKELTKFQEFNFHKKPSQKYQESEGDEEIEDIQVEVRGFVRLSFA